MADQIGFIGLGAMGFPMLERLTATGVNAVAYDISPWALGRAENLPNVALASSSADLASRASTLFTCLPSEDAVRDTYLGPGGIVEGARGRIVTCDCSTMTPEFANELDSELSGRGLRHLEAPIFGTPEQAQEATLYFRVAKPGIRTSLLKPKTL